MNEDFFEKLDDRLAELERNMELSERALQILRDLSVMQKKRLEKLEDVLRSIGHPPD